MKVKLKVIIPNLEMVNLEGSNSINIQDLPKKDFEKYRAAIVKSLDDAYGGEDSNCLRGRWVALTCCGE